LEQLSGLDALFVHAEMHGLPMHLSSFSVYDPSTCSGGAVDFRQIVDLFERRIQTRVPVLRSRLVQVPFNMDQPYWEEDPNFDMVYHVRHIALPKPGDWHKLCSMLANLHAQPLNRKRPLWEAYVIDGLETVDGFPKGAFGIMLKVHHSIMDGRTGMAIFNNLHSAVASVEEKDDDFDIFTEQPIMELNKSRSAMRLIGHSYLNNLKKTFNLSKLIGKGVSTYTEVKLALKTQDVRSHHKPKTRFNGSISPRRIIDRVILPIDQIKVIKGLFPGQTLNDVALTVIGGALREYLEQKHELPEPSLVAGVPIDVRKEGDRDIKGNLINVTNVALRTDIEDPIKRLEAVHIEARSGKNFAHLMGDHSIHDLFENLYPGLVSWGIRAAVESGVLEKFPPANNTIVTNVPGTKEPVYMAGAKLVESFGLGPLIPNTGLFHTVSTTYSHLTIAFTACRHMMDDPDFYVRCLTKSFNELFEAANEKLLARADYPEMPGAIKQKKGAESHEPKPH